MAKFCPSCGTKNKDDAQFCVNCGKPLPTIKPEPTYRPPTDGPVQSQTPLITPEMMGRAKDTVSDLTKKAESFVSSAVDTARSAASSLSEQVQTSRSDYVERETTREPKGDSRRPGTQSLSFSGSELWTWLKKDDRRQLFYKEGGIELSESEYVKKVEDKIKENNVPATIVSKQVTWDRSAITDDLYFIKPNTKGVNPLSCYLKFAQVGYFSFSEQKTFLVPPNLPQVPEKKREVPTQSPTLLFLGIALFVVSAVISFIERELGSYSGVRGSAWPYLAFFAGIALIVLWYMSFSRIREAKQHNNMVDRQIAEWNRAWDRWEDEVFVHSFQETTNGEVTRVYQSVFDCIRQVNDELFKDSTVAEERDENKMGELEALIARRKEAYR